MLMSENWLKRDVRCNLCTEFVVRFVYVDPNNSALMVNGNADNQSLLIAVTHWVERTDFDQVGSLVLFNRNMPKKNDWL